MKTGEEWEMGPSAELDIHVVRRRERLPTETAEERETRLSHLAYTHIQCNFHVLLYRGIIICFSHARKNSTSFKLNYSIGNDVSQLEAPFSLTSSIALLLTLGRVNFRFSATCADCSCFSGLCLHLVG